MKKLIFSILAPLILAITVSGQDISFTLTPEEEAEKASWLAKGLMYPKYGYDKVSWGATLDEVKKHYSGLVNTSDEDSLFGMKKFSQKVGSGGIVKRDFYFYQGGLLKVTVQYDKSVKVSLLDDKIRTTYGEEVYPLNANANYYSPSLTTMGDITNTPGRFLEEGERPDRIKDCYPIATYEPEVSLEITRTVKKQRQELQKQRNATAKKKQLDVLDF